jgi:arylsulfatase A-like enzyme
MASLLKRHGYGTAAIGKWHLGYGKGDETPQWRTDYAAELSPGPLDIGFDYHFGVPSNHGDLTGVYVENRYVYGLSSGKVPEGMTIAGPAAGSEDYQATYEAKDTEGGKGGDRILKLDAPRRKNERVMKVLTDKATGWLRQQPKDRPFFLYFTPVAVHNPVTPDRDIAGQSKAGPYGDWIHELDRSVGRILETLDAIGVADNTLVLFTSDNGGGLQARARDAANRCLSGGAEGEWRFARREARRLGGGIQSPVLDPLARQGEGGIDQSRDGLGGRSFGNDCRDRR